MRRTKVLIIGGAGIAGQSIVDCLRSYHDICDLYIASRSIHKGPSRGITGLRLDIHDVRAVKVAIRQFDIIVLALGPFSEVGKEIYIQCLKSRVICIDINDDYQHCKCLLELGSLTKEYQGTILTGMGLCPGMTTYMLGKAVERLGEAATDAHLRIYFGAGISSGKASITNMFNAFKDEAQVLFAGEVRKKKDVQNKREKTFTFDEAHSNLPLVYFSSPEIATLRRSDSFKAIQNFDSAFHLQHLPMSMVFWLKRSAIVRKVIIKMVGAQQKKLGNNTKNEKSVIVNASVHGLEKEVTCSLYSDSSYRLTGVFCASIIVLLIRETLSIPAGVYAYEDLEMDLRALEEVLKENNISISVKE